ncbi:hypothetical protein RBSWK_06406 [Rhodopirellula baltica SWK14]|uniref:Uncharacterized protein n=1 Tax=Rhodopirellula baltica SWK14 TaxID=993516 RepID=L7C7A7_RHOBT|nr:hypothetical protein RBSWK_06406 [Rhodopirellula baltica SWK14]
MARPRSAAEPQWRRMPRTELKWKFTVSYRGELNKTHVFCGVKPLCTW